MPRQLWEHRQYEKDYNDISNYWCHMSRSRLQTGCGRAGRRIDKGMKNDLSDLKWQLISSDDGRSIECKWWIWMWQKSDPPRQYNQQHVMTERGCLMVFVVVWEKGLTAASDCICIDFIKFAAWTQMLLHQSELSCFWTTDVRLISWIIQSPPLITLCFSQCSQVICSVNIIQAEVMSLLSLSISVRVTESGFWLTVVINN